VQAQSAGQLSHVSPAPHRPSPQPTHLPEPSQVKPPLQVPQDPPQPFEPHCFPLQLGEQQADW
jgi:hypothetical protein